MEFNIRKKATLPYLEVNLLKSGSLDYNYNNTNLTDATITMNMKNVDTDVFKIVNAPCTYSSSDNTIYYQFTKKNTSDVGRFEVTFKISNEQGDVLLPLKEKLFTNILNSFSNSDFCCGPNKFVNPTPAPAVPGIYYGKFIQDTITSGDVLSNLIFFETSSPTNSFYVLPSKPQPQYGYILIPVGFDQPTAFRDSSSGCFGNNAPMDNTVIEQIIINNINGIPTTYNVYRTFYPFVGQINLWLCN